MKHLIKPFALVSADLPDMRTPEQRRSYDRIEEKRWRWRVEQNRQRRWAARQLQPSFSSRQFIHE